MKLVIPGTLPTLNEMINSSKRNKYAYVKLKDNAIRQVGWAVKENMGKYRAPLPADFIITWYCPNKRKDKDNVIAGQKYIFDGLQEIGVMDNDGWKQIHNITHRFEVDRLNPRVEVEIMEVGA